MGSNPISRLTSYGTQTAGLPTENHATRAIEFEKHLNDAGWSTWSFCGAEEYKNGVANFIKSEIDKDGNNKLNYKELMSLGISRSAAEFLIKEHNADEIGTITSKGGDGSGLSKVLYDLDADDWITLGGVSNDAIKDLEKKAAIYFAENPHLKDFSDDQTSTNTTSGGTYEEKVGRLLDEQSVDPIERDLTIKRPGLDEDDNPWTLEGSIESFSSLIAAHGDGEISNEKLKLIGLNNTGINNILKGTTISDVTKIENVVSLIDKLDGNGDGVIRKSTIAALNRGEIIATNYIPSDITATNGQPEGFDEKSEALTAAKAFIKDAGCTDDDKEMKRQDIYNILFPGIIARGETPNEANANKVIDGFIKKYGKDGKITGGQAAEGLVDLDQQGNTSNCCKTYDGIIDQQHLEALIAEEAEAPEENNNNGNNGNANTNNGGNTTPPSNNAVNNVYTPPTTTNDLKDDVEAVKQQHTKKSGGLFGNLFGGGLGKTLGLAAIITGFFMMMKNNKQSTSQYTPNYYAGGYNPYPQGGQAINGMGGMMNIFG